MQVNNNIPVPTRNTPNTRNQYNFERLRNRGESIYIKGDAKQMQRIRNAAFMYGKYHNFHIVTQSDMEGIRIWRADEMVNNDQK